MLEWTEPALLDPAWREGLLGEDKIFGLVDETVLGTTLPVFAQRPRSLAEVLVNGAEQHADRAALIGPDRTITFAELPAEVAALAKRLTDDHGVRKGDRVAFAGIPSVEHCLALWAVMSLGAIATTMNPAWIATEFDQAIEITSPVLMLCDDVLIERLAERVTTEAFLDLTDGIEVTDQALPPVDIDEDDPVAIVFTSGTTGRPKGATLSHRNAIQFSLSTAATTAVHSIVHEVPAGRAPSRRSWRALPCSTSRVSSASSPTRPSGASAWCSHPPAAGTLPFTSSSPPATRSRRGPSFRRSCGASSSTPTSPSTICPRSR